MVGKFFNRKSMYAFIVVLALLVGSIIVVTAQERNIVI